MLQFQRRTSFPCVWPELSSYSYSYLHLVPNWGRDLSEEEEEREEKERGRARDMQLDEKRFFGQIENEEEEDEENEDEEEDEEEDNEYDYSQEYSDEYAIDLENDGELLKRYASRGADTNYFGDGIGYPKKYEQDIKEFGEVFAIEGVWRSWGGDGIFKYPTKKMYVQNKKEWDAWTEWIKEEKDFEFEEFEEESDEEDDWDEEDVEVDEEDGRYHPY